jgi:hypothetical protein
MRNVLALTTYPQLYALALLIAALLGVLPFLRSGEQMLLLIMLAGLYLILFSMRHLLPATLLLGILAMLSKTDGVLFALPYVQVMPGVRMSLRDALLVVMLPLALVTLRRRGERPLFTWPILGVAGVVVIGFVLGALSDGSLSVPFNMLRPLFGFSLYFIVVAAVTSWRQLVWLMTASVAMQIVEEASSQLILSRAVLPSSEEVRSVELAGQVVPYPTNRAEEILFLGLFLALGCLFEWQSLRAHAGLAAICLIGWLLDLGRAWYISIVVGVLAMLLSVRGWQARARFGATIAAIGAMIASVTTYANGLTISDSGGSLLERWLARSATLATFQEQSTYLIRQAATSWQWNQVLGAPLFGYGLSRKTTGLLDSDTGVVNTLLIFGFLGTATFVVLIARAIHASIVTWQRLPPSRERGYALGILSAWVGLLAGYAFTWDFMTNYFGPWFVVLALAIGDRLRASTQWLEQGAPAQPSTLEPVRCQQL